MLEIPQERKICRHITDIEELASEVPFGEGCDSWEDSNCSLDGHQCKYSTIRLDWTGEPLD